jgi:hypothetical protein
MRRRFMILLAAAMPVALAPGLATVAVGSVPAAQAASTCDGRAETQIGDFVTSNSSGTGLDGQWWYTSSGVAGVNAKVWALVGAQTAGSYWCEVPSTNPKYPKDTLLRYQGTSDCATFDAGSTGGPTGNASGEGTVDLQVCDDATPSQNWDFLVGSEITTAYNSTGTCLSAKEISSGTTPLVMVGPSCTGQGGQAWIAEPPVGSGTN